MAGLNMTVEELAADVRALTYEMTTLTQRVERARSDDEREKLAARVELVREQLQLRGAEGVAPQRRAVKRDQVPGREVRA